MAESAKDPGRDHAGRPAMGPRCMAIVGPFQSGKTTLLEAILARGGAVDRQGRVGDGNTVGDASPEARSHGMTVGPTSPPSSSWAIA